eukprot:jgi/Psemu1/10997/gm1.10997_g
MTGVLWRKQLSKAADSGITFVNGSTIWPKEMHKPFTFALEGPHAWLNDNVQRLGITCYGVWYPGCFSQDPGDQFPILLPRNLDNCLIYDKRMADEDSQQFKNPCDGDHLMTPFQCKNCCFLNLKGRAGMNGCPTDDLLGKFIRRVTLNAFWSQERPTATVSCLPPWGPTPQEDFWGMKVAWACFSGPENPVAMPGVCSLKPLGNGGVQRGMWLPDALVTLEIMDLALDDMEDEWKSMSYWEN